MKVPGPDHPITIAPEPRRVRVVVADINRSLELARRLAQRAGCVGLGRLLERTQAAEVSVVGRSDGTGCHGEPAAL